MAKATKVKSADLGLLQEEFESADKAWNSAEKALARAQELRNGSKAKREAADQALRTATQLILG